MIGNNIPNVLKEILPEAEDKLQEFISERYPTIASYTSNFFKLTQENRLPYNEKFTNILQRYVFSQEIVSERISNDLEKKIINDSEFKEQYRIREKNLKILEAQLALLGAGLWDETWEQFFESLDKWTDSPELPFINLIRDCKITDLKSLNEYLKEPFFQHNHNNVAVITNAFLKRNTEDAEKQRFFEYLSNLLKLDLEEDDAILDITAMGEMALGLKVKKFLDTQEAISNQAALTSFLTDPVRCQLSTFKKPGIREFAKNLYGLPVREIQERLRINSETTFQVNEFIVIPYPEKKGYLAVKVSEQGKLGAGAYGAVYKGIFLSNDGNVLPGLYAAKIVKDVEEEKEWRIVKQLIKDKKELFTAMHGTGVLTQVNYLELQYLPFVKLFHTLTQHCKWPNLNYFKPAEINNIRNCVNSITIQQNQYNLAIIATAFFKRHPKLSTEEINCFLILLKQAIQFKDSDKGRKIVVTALGLMASGISLADLKSVYHFPFINNRIDLSQEMNMADINPLYEFIADPKACTLGMFDYIKDCLDNPNIIAKQVKQKRENAILKKLQIGLNHEANLALKAGHLEVLPIKNFPSFPAAAPSQLATSIIADTDQVTSETQFILPIEFVRGSDGLEEILDYDATFAERAQLAYQVSLALHTIHKEGVLHGDVKPANIRINKKTLANGKNIYDVMLIDFGFSKELAGHPDDVAKSIHFIVGSPAYQAEEIAINHKAYGAKADWKSIVPMFIKIFGGEDPMRLKNKIYIKNGRIDNNYYNAKYDTKGMMNNNNFLPKKYNFMRQTVIDFIDRCQSHYTKRPTESEILAFWTNLNAFATLVAMDSKDFNKGNGFTKKDIEEHASICVKLSRGSKVDQYETKRDDVSFVAKLDDLWQDIQKEQNKLNWTVHPALVSPSKIPLFDDISSILISNQISFAKTLSPNPMIVENERSRETLNNQLIEITDRYLKSNIIPYGNTELSNRVKRLMADHRDRDDLEEKINIKINIIEIFQLEELKNIVTSCESKIKLENYQTDYVSAQKSIILNPDSNNQQKTAALKNIINIYQVQELKSIITNMPIDKKLKKRFLSRQVNSIVTQQNDSMEKIEALKTIINNCYAKMSITNLMKILKDGRSSKEEKMTILKHIINTLTYWLNKDYTLISSERRVRDEFYQKVFNFRERAAMELMILAYKDKKLPTETQEKNHPQEKQQPPVRKKTALDLLADKIKEALFRFVTTLLLDAPQDFVKHHGYLDLVKKYFIEFIKEARDVDVTKMKIDKNPQDFIKNVIVGNPEKGIPGLSTEETLKCWLSLQTTLNKANGEHFIMTMKKNPLTWCGLFQYSFGSGRDEKADSIYKLANNHQLSDFASNINCSQPGDLNDSTLNIIPDILNNMTTALEQTIPPAQLNLHHGNNGT